MSIIINIAVACIILAMYRLDSNNDIVFSIILFNIGIILGYLYKK